jgi:glycopeptide antibiotics resistance protein
VAGRWLWLNVAMKTLLVGLLLFSVFSDLERFNGKAMLARALTYPLAALVVPIVWWLRGSRPPYPHLIDALVVLPFVIDTGGNVLDLYSVYWFDDFAHFLNWLILVSAVALALRRTQLGLLVSWGLAVGFGAATEILWEIGEYTVMKLGSSGLQLTYVDTIGDLALGGCGTLLGASVVAAVSAFAIGQAKTEQDKDAGSARTG